MANFNKVILAGNLTRDPELSYLPSNTAVCEFGMAVNRKYRGSDGEMREDTCFVDLTAFGKQAEVIKQYMSKGRSILVEGRLKFSSWENKEGQRRSKLTVVAEQFQFLGAPGGGSRSGSGGSGGGRAEAPARSGAATGGGGYEDNDMPPADDDIPF